MITEKLNLKIDFFCFCGIYMYNQNKSAQNPQNMVSLAAKIVYVRIHLKKLWSKDLFLFLQP